MKAYHLTRSQVIPKPIDEVFPFFEQPENLAGITPPWLDFRIITPPPLVMRQGALFDYTIRVMGIRGRWTTLIAEYDPPHRFVDVQLSGPYSFWHHTHRFETEGGGTRMLDDVRYILPFGYLGRVVHASVVRRLLDGIFDYRSCVIESLYS